MKRILSFASLAVILTASAFGLAATKSTNGPCCGQSCCQHGGDCCK